MEDHSETFNATGLGSNLCSIEVAPTWVSNILDNFFPGAYFLSHSLSWTNNKENRGLFGGKVWIPEDPATSKANGRYPAEWRELLTNGVYTGLNETIRVY